MAKVQKTLMLNAFPSYLKKSYLCRRKVVKDFRCKILRGKQVRILYSTRCCEFHKEERQKVTVERWEDAVLERVRKPAICVLLSLREVGGCKRDPNRALRSNHCPKHLSNLNAEDMRLWYFLEKLQTYTDFFRSIPLFTIH